MNPKKNRNILLYSDTARSADALHFGGVAMHDPFIALSARGRKYAVVSALEFGRVKRHSDFGTVLPLEAWLEKARRAWPRRSPGPALVVALLARELKAGPFPVPDDFPAGLYRELCGLGLRIRISAGALFPEREIKSPSGAAGIGEGNRCSATGIAAAERLLRACRVRAGRLLHKGSVLTSERVKVAVETACIEEGSVSDSTIVAAAGTGGAGPPCAQPTSSSPFSPRGSPPPIPAATCPARSCGERRATPRGR